MTFPKTQSREDEQLRPCPFCNGKPRMSMNHERYTYIGCDNLRNCPVFPTTKAYANREFAIKAWNAPCLATPPEKEVVQGEGRAPQVALVDALSLAEEVINLRAELTALRNADRWIDVKQELPPLDADNCCMDEADYGRYSDPVLVFEEDESITTTAVYDGQKDEWSDARNGGQFFGVRHWMPLPKPPYTPLNPQTGPK